MGKLCNAGLPGKKRKNKARELQQTIVFMAIVFSILASTVMLASGTYFLFLADDSEPVSEESTTTTHLTPLTSTTSTTSSTTTSTSIHTSTTTTTTSTTTLCGGISDEPCTVSGCDDGLILDSSDLCQDPECAPSVASGKDGCGSFALNYCKT